MPVTASTGRRCVFRNLSTWLRAFVKKLRPRSKFRNSKIYPPPLPYVPRSSNDVTPCYYVFPLVRKPEPRIRALRRRFSKLSVKRRRARRRRFRSLMETNSPKYRAKLSRYLRRGSLTATCKQLIDAAIKLNARGSAWAREATSLTNDRRPISANTAGSRLP